MGTHPIFESDFDCLTVKIMKTLLEDDEIVRINVGGVKFTTLRSTLLRYSHSILARMINGKIPPRRDSEGNAFLDRDPQIFKFILEFLRSSKVVISDDLIQGILPQLLHEAEYFMIDPLVEELRHRQARLNKKDALDCHDSIRLRLPGRYKSLYQQWFYSTRYYVQQDKLLLERHVHSRSTAIHISARRSPGGTIAVHHH